MLSGIFPWRSLSWISSHFKNVKLYKFYVTESEILLGIQIDTQKIKTIIMQKIELIFNVYLMTQIIFV